MHRGTFLSGLLVLLLASALLADGFFYRLPADGAWVEYRMDGTYSRRRDMKKPVTGSLRIRSVGSEVVDGTACRWIETEWAQKMGDEARTHITKALIPEKDLVQGKTPYDAILKSWTSRAGGRPKEGLGADSPLLLFMSGPQTDVKELDAKTFKTTPGELTGGGTSGQLELDEGRLQFAVGWETYHHNDSPFGVLATTINLKITVDDELNESAILNFTLANAGTDAESKLTDPE